MKVEIKKSALEHLAVDTLVVFVGKSTQTKPGKAKGSKKSDLVLVTTDGVSAEIQSKILAAAKEGAVTGSNNETIFFRDSGLAGAKHLLTVGLGEAKDLDLERIRQASASFINCLKSAKVKSVALALDTVTQHSLEESSFVQAIVEGALLANYSFQELKGVNGSTEGGGIEKLLLVSNTKNRAFEHGLEAGTVIAESVNFARRLGDRPGNCMTPTLLADETVKAAKGSKLKVSIWNKTKIKTEKMGSFLSVSLGSSQEPKFIAMEYKGAAASQKPVCFVGKGLTFDSGGISIKPSGGMEEMKYDMCGGANVIATMLAIAKLNLKINAIAFVPATENMPGPNANKPGDIVTARNGKTIEINNTDAEGRLILADALVYASEKKPAVIIDAATLTGAIVVALGNTHTGVFTRNDELAATIQNASNVAGEWVWRMPITDFHSKDMKGTYADLSNTSSAKGAGSATAAAFLESFVDKEIPWAHFDIAGTAWHVGDRLPYCPRKGASGVMVRTFLEIAKSFQ
jgi:leucyl aminopeptidase